MSVPTDALSEMAVFDLDVDGDTEDMPIIGSSSHRNSTSIDSGDVLSSRRSIMEISRMADRMAYLLQETRNINVEADSRLRQLEVDLSLIALERSNG